MRLTATLILTLSTFLTSFKEKDEVYIWYPHEVGIVQTCNGAEVELFIEITSESVQKVKVHSFSFDKSDFTIFNDNIAFAKTDTIILSKNKPFKLKVKYKLLNSERPTTFSFKTNLDKYLNNSIKLSYGQYLITTSDIRAGKEQFINVTESCQDSIIVFFPYGGTVSGATLYNDSSRTKEEFKSVSYGFGGGENFITFTKADVGRYFVHFSSCHWGGDYWLTIK